MKRLVFYFSATGNSLYIARELARGTEGQALSIPYLLKKGNLKFEAEEIGFVQPLFGHMPPNLIREFIARAELKADYFFSIFTFGMRKGSVVELWDNISRQAGYPMDYISSIQMVDNWLHHFDMNEQQKIDKHIPEQLARVKQDIQERRQLHQPTTHEEREIHQNFLRMSHLTDKEGFRMSARERFVIGDACIKCGVCTKVCPRGNYRIENQSVNVGGLCDYCLACIHNCPQKAIGFAPSSNPLLIPEVNPHARYRNPHVRLAEIMEANNQY